MKIEQLLLKKTDELKKSSEYIFYKDELENENTQYFIIDTHGTKTNIEDRYQESDFSSYTWNLKQYKQVNEGDLFIYRRPQSSSEISGEFYFFGAGKFGEITLFEDGNVMADIVKGLKFTDYVLKRELDEAKWFFKERTRSDWQYFFNQYGMNKITKNDFLMLLDYSHSDGLVTDVVNLESKVDTELNKSYRVEDKMGRVNLRGSDHTRFAREVKANYEYTCAITGIRTKKFLVASHIVPWSKDKDNRTNPQNGICLSSLMDKAFDQGYITISPDFKVIVSEKAKKDDYLNQQLKEYHGNKIKLPTNNFPNEMFLNWHRKHIFNTVK
ncbi:HNH endonuclease [Marinilactibacillus psychrotolerans]|uniref:HNH endonuclease n=1 Tax=Marinilactibacillus psychrotolerans TaxID=191770 RepID=UPI001D00C898|nr:HNH endonuclease [Marinilactibacillus psychrotolerans]